MWLVPEWVHDGHVAVDGEEEGVGHGGGREQELQGPCVRVHVVIDVALVDFPAEVGHDWCAHDSDAEVCQFGSLMEKQHVGLYRNVKKGDKK